MKRSYYFLLILLPISLIIFLPGCKKEDTPTAPNQLPKIESLDAKPATVLINTETAFTCVATDGDGDNLTITWSSKRGVFANGVIGATVRWVAPSTAGTDTINVTVNDGKQTVKGKIEIIVGAISVSPTLLEPISKATEVVLSPTLTWIPINGATSYTLQVSTSSSFTSFVYNQSGLNNANQQISGLSIATLYYWRVNATNIYGTSEWSNVFNFKTVAAPQAPTLVSPANSATEVTLAPILNWNSVMNATSYTLQVSEFSSFNNNNIYNHSGLTNTSQQITGLIIDKRYYWRVSSTNIYGTSEWSSVFNFKTVAAPQAPTLVSPAPNEENISLEPTLSWSPSNNATNYTLQISTTATFNDFVYKQDVGSNLSRQINGLKKGTDYYWRVNATNNYGTSSWSITSSFVTILPTPVSCPGIPTITYVAKTYNTIQIGNQCWLKENLDVGTRINGSSSQTNNSTVEKYCYNDDVNNCATYGGLYQWAEAVQYKNGASNSTSPSPALTGNIQGICPSGWHIPSYAELQTLVTAVRNKSYALKAIGQGTGSGAGNNSSGFSALLAGCRVMDSFFRDLGDHAYFWSSTESNAASAYYLGIDYISSSFDANYSYKSFGFSVRCIKD